MFLNSIHAVNLHQNKSCTLETLFAYFSQDLRPCVIRGFELEVFHPEVFIRKELSLLPPKNLSTRHLVAVLITDSRNQTYGAGVSSSGVVVSSSGVVFL